MKISQTKYHTGFTLIEILVVMALLSTLFAVVVVLINPARYFAQANNTTRLNDINTLLNAISQYAADNKGTFPTGITTSVQTIKTGAADICLALIPKYIAALPVDPKVNGGAAITDCGTTYDTGYTVVQSATDSHITIAAPNAELGKTISITR